jgi:chromosome segregation ATPase
MPDWLTYAQAGERFGISADAVRFRARRQGWRMQPGNDGRTLVLVPDDAEVHPRSSAVRSPDRSADQSGDQIAQTEGAAHYIEALQFAIAALREAKDGEIATLHGVIEGLQASISRAEDRAGRAEAARDEERARADALRDRLNAQVVTAETTEARAAAQRERLDTMQAQLTEAHAALQAAVETERRSARAEQEIAGERTRADDLRMQIDVLNAETIVARAEAERALSEEQ